MSQKIVNLIQNKDRLSYSFEITPDIRKEVLEQLEFEPLFYSITWHAKKYEHLDVNIAPIKFAKYLRADDKNVLIHISCTDLKKDLIDKFLAYLQDIDVCNLFIILGENYDSNNSDFKSTKDLILYIRRVTGSYFCIGVAGFPDSDSKFLHLQDKVKSGADFILTQAFFDYSIYKKFIKVCRQKEIYVPVIPGIFPFDTNKQLKGFINICDVHLPKDSITIPQDSGIDFVARLVYEMIGDNYNHFHLFTLNRLQRSLKLIKKVDEYKNLLVSKTIQ